MYPLACPLGPATPHKGTTCGNPEAYSSDLVVSQVTLEVDSRFSNYGARAYSLAVGGDAEWSAACRENAFAHADVKGSGGCAAPAAGNTPLRDACSRPTHQHRPSTTNNNLTGNEGGGGIVYNGNS